MIYRKLYSQQRETWIKRCNNPQGSLIYRKLYCQQRASQKLQQRASFWSTCN